MSTIRLSSPEPPHRPFSELPSKTAGGLHPYPGWVDVRWGLKGYPFRPSTGRVPGTDPLPSSHTPTRPLSQPTRVGYGRRGSQEVRRGTRTETFVLLTQTPPSSPSLFWWVTEEGSSGTWRRDPGGKSGCVWNPSTV